MGVSGKPQLVDGRGGGGGGLESDGKKWVIAGISLRAPLKPIYTNPADDHKDKEEEESCSTTPTGQEARIPTLSTCPPAPMKRKPSLKCNYGSVRDFFTPPDLETVFIRHV